MKRISSDNAGAEETHKVKFMPALEGSGKRKIRGLWVRAGVYYAQIRMPSPKGGTMPKRIRLTSKTLTEAKKDMEKARVASREGTLPAPRRSPRFNDFAIEYQASPFFEQKKERTRNGEKDILKYWIEHLGNVRLDKITESHVREYRDKRIKNRRNKVLGKRDVAARTVNKETTVFFQVMKLAHDRGHISSVPRVRQMKQLPPPKRRLLSPKDVEHILSCCQPGVTKYANDIRWYLQFLALSGCREREAYAIRLQDINFNLGKVTIGSDGDTKNREHRSLDMSQELKLLLHEIVAAREKVTIWLFPSPQRGPKDIHASKLRESLYKVREAAGFPWLGFHDFRHFFISMCVMAGIDFMTIASWVGHKDGGVLIGKVYGHLADDHKQRMAEGLSILSDRQTEKKDANKNG